MLYFHGTDNYPKWSDHILGYLENPQEKLRTIIQFLACVCLCIFYWIGTQQSSKEMSLSPVSRTPEIQVCFHHPHCPKTAQLSQTPRSLGSRHSLLNALLICLSILLLPMQCILHSYLIGKETGNQQGWLTWPWLSWCQSLSGNPASLTFI